MSNATPRLLLLFVFLLSLGLPVPALAKSVTSLTGGEMEFTFADLGEGDMTISVIYEQQFVDFPVPEGRKIDSAVLHLHMQHSDKLLPDLSDIVIAVNDEPVNNIILTAENTNATLDIDIPVEALKPGENELLLRFSQRRSEERR